MTRDTSIKHTRVAVSLAPHTHTMRRTVMFLGAPGVGKGTYAARVSARLNIPTISTGDLIRREIQNGTTQGLVCSLFSDAGELVPDDVVNGLVEARLTEPDCMPFTTAVGGGESGESGASGDGSGRGRVHGGGYLLDGFPRNLSQARDFDARLDGGGQAPLGVVVNIVLKEEYLMQKVLGRRVCTSCGNSYSTAHCLNEAEGVDMPPLLPSHGDATRCDCGEPLSRRSDDQEDLVRNRLRVYHEETAPLVDYYAEQGTLRQFEVKKGLADLPILFALLEDSPPA